MRSKRTLSKKWDVFLCHASKDKDEIARPLAQQISSLKISVWFDEFEIKVGDSITEKIEEGLAKSQFGILIFSKNFLKRRWPVKERNSLFNKEIQKQKKVILPLRYDIS